MDSLFDIFFGFPSVLVIALLAIIGVVITVSNIFEAIRIKDFMYLYALTCVTIVAALIGWLIGGSIG